MTSTHLLRVEDIGAVEVTVTEQGARSWCCTVALLAATGHLPQVETPGDVASAISDFVASHPAWAHEYSVETAAAPEAVWAALRALYPGTKLSARSDTIATSGPFAAGTELAATPNGADFVIYCKITEVVEQERCAYRSEFDGVYITSRHVLARLADGGTRITHRSEISGPKAATVGPQIGPRITDDHPEAMDDLVAAAQARAAGPGE